MKTKTTKVSLLALALLAIGCNEQVAPELKESNNTNNGGSTVVVPPTEYYFRVVDKSLEYLNYKVHRTGDARAEAKCEVRKTTPLASLLYTSESPLPHDSKTNDITCYFDAEELALYHSGMSFAYEASPNTCEYVAYGPFSYYERIPGSSTSAITQVNCMNDDTNDGHAATAGSPEHTTPGTRAGCGQSVDTSIRDFLGNDDVTLKTAFISPEDNRDYCRFDYTSTGGPNCDEGVITLTNHEVTYTLGDSSAVPPIPASLKSSKSISKISCGGKAANCIMGPIKFEPSIASQTGGSVITRTEINTPFTRTVELPGLIEEQRGSNRDYVNFRRNLASTQINYVNDGHASYLGAFASPAYNKSFEPALMDLYSNNKRMNGAALVTPAQYHAQSIANGYTAKPLASEPFIGMTNQHRTNPFYTFYCLDRAMEIKARIRMVVRDWDRVFPSSTQLELISDIHLGANARQDVPDDVEVPGDQDPYNYYNDWYDWDDFLMMSRTFETYNPSTTIWNPYNGFFDPSNFPQGGFQ